MVRPRIIHNLAEAISLSCIMSSFTHMVYIKKCDHNVILFLLFQISSRYQVGDWVKFKRSITAPTYGWQGAKHKSVGFVQSVLDKSNLIVSFCSGEARVLANEVIKLIPLDRGQHVQLRQYVKEPRYCLWIHSLITLCIYIYICCIFSGKLNRYHL